MVSEFRLATADATPAFGDLDRGSCSGVPIPGGPGQRVVGAFVAGAFVVGAFVVGVRGLVGALVGVLTGGFGAGGGGTGPGPSTPSRCRTEF